MMKIIIIVVYFGTFPEYFNVWLKTCKTNSAIDFLIVTNSKLEKYNLPNNVKIFSCSLADIKNIASNKMGFAVTLDRPYKLCDFKPAYGLLFEEYIKGYDYWGHCDIDLVWGNISGFLEKFQIYNYDKFSDRGHFTLYRNTYEINRTFMKEIDHISYRKVYTIEKSAYFDEDPMNYLFKKLGKKVFDYCIYSDINLFYYDFRHADHPSKPHNYKKQIFIWENGHIYQYYKKAGNIEKQEWLYLHFQKRNLKVVSDGKYLGNKFLITNKGFVNFDKEITEESILKYNHRGDFKQNLYRTEYVYTGKTKLVGIEFLKFLLLRSYSLLCNSRIWRHTIWKIWCRIRV